MHGDAEIPSPSDTGEFPRHAARGRIFPVPSLSRTLLRPMNTRVVPSHTSKPTGEHFEFLASSRGPGAHLEFRWTLAPGKRGPGEHYHPRETETFTVLSGSLRIWINGVPKDYAAG